jgi:CO/xanthine dehydrogenase FAD-binding subunit
VRVALGSVAPTIVRATDAEAFAADALDRSGTWDDPAAPVSNEVLEEFGQRAAAAARPIDDVRGTATYRRHACAVLARRALRWALDDRQQPSG